MTKFIFLALLTTLLLMITIILKPAGALSKNLKGDYVILLHGLGRTSKSMQPLEKYLAEKKYLVINIDYKSHDCKAEQLVAQIHLQIKKECKDDKVNVHFVTHSLGGIIVRYYLKHYTLSNLGRVVMLSPPNQGSELVDKLGEYPLFLKTMGPASLQLGTSPESLPNILGPVNFELGVITGSSSIDPISSSLIPDDDDGKVSIKRSKVQGMKDFIVLPYSHAYIMKRKEVFEQTLHFIVKGKFKTVDNDK